MSPLVWEARGSYWEREFSWLPDVSCVKNGIFPKRGSPIRTSIRMQMKVFANQIHLLLFVCEEGQYCTWRQEIDGSRKTLFPLLQKMPP